MTSYLYLSFVAINLLIGFVLTRTVNDFTAPLPNLSYKTTGGAKVAFIEDNMSVTRGSLIGSMRCTL